MHASGSCRAVVKAFLERGASRVLAGDSPAVGNATAAAKTAGIYEQVVANGGEWVDFGADQITVSCRTGKIVKSFEFAAQFMQADVVVSVAKLKTHQLMAYTGAMKNLFGLMVGLKKAQTHYRFPGKKEFGMFLVDLTIAAGASYAVMDAVVGMEGKGGPGNGDPVQLGFLASSDNIAALDWECASIVGYNPHEIVYLEEALRRGVWFTSPEQIQTAGCTAGDVKPASFKIVRNAVPVVGAMIPPVVDAAAKLVFTRNPSFNRLKCVHCERCVEICPVHILSLVESKKGEKRVTISSRCKCLHCYCCHEVCPADAVQLRHFTQKHY